MFERFTEKAIKVIMLAQEEARLLGHNFVGTEQILLGLIGEGTGFGARGLKSVGVNLKDARFEVEKIIGRGSDSVAVEIPFTPRAKRVLELSWNAARELGHNYIGTEHLLLGIIAEDGGVAIRVLQNLGVNLPALEAHLLKLVKQQSKPSHVESSNPGAPLVHPNRLNLVSQWLEKVAALVGIIHTSIENTDQRTIIESAMSDVDVKNEWQDLDAELSKIADLMADYSKNVEPKIAKIREEIRRMTGES